jgi:hypothetical protein
MEQELLHIITRLGVESAKWFVHQEDFGFDDESAGDRDTLLHTARQLVWWVPFEAVQPYHVNEILDTLPINVPPISQPEAE